MLEKIKKLVTELNAASEAYYNGQKEVMTNFEWDAKFDELSRLEEESGIILPDSPTQKVSADETKGKKEKHEFPALSLAKTKSVEELIKWANDRIVNMSWKLDGLTLVATYDKGKLSKLLTRGNGTIGTNITHLAPAINHLPLKIDYKGHMVVRGEALISYEDFERINSEIEDEDDKYANPRNLASGTLNLDDLDEIKRRNVQFIAFTPVYFEDNDFVDIGDARLSLKEWGNRMWYLNPLGFKTVPRRRCENSDKIKHYINVFTDSVSECKFPVDGLVICYDDWAYSQTGSVTGHHATRAGFAFKWKDEAIQTKVTGIDYTVTKTGIISQVAVFEPVEIAGTTVTRATIPNMNYRADMDLKIGDRVEVIKANMIIPQIIRNLDKEERFSYVVNDMDRYDYPRTCPCCGGTVGINESESGTMNLICTNPDCSMKLVKKIAHFADRDCMNIMGLSEKKIEFLLENHYIDSILSLYQMKNHGKGPALENEEGWDCKSVDNLFAAIDKSRTCDFVSFMHAMCIPNFGKGQAKLLKKHLDKIWPEYEEEMETEMNADASYDLMGLLYLLRVNHDYDFRVIDGFGDVINWSLCQWIDKYLVDVPTEDLAKGTNDAWVWELLDELSFTDSKPISADVVGSVISGKTFVVTGDVHFFKNRAELSAKIESLGGKVTGSVTKKTDYLINNDVTSTSGKNQKAKELGISIISEEEFCKLAGITYL